MLDFPEDFFEEEVRENFTVDSTMKCFWAAEMEVLREIAEICERHELTWYCAYGTLLGAVRHQGYVPWDDDMDIWMLREDYMKFLEVAAEELPQEYIIQSPLSEMGYHQFHSCIMNAHSVSVSPERLQHFHNCPFIVGVDIFPLDYLPADAAEKKEERELFDRITMAANLLDKGEWTPEHFAYIIETLRYLGNEKIFLNLGRAERDELDEEKLLEDDDWLTAEKLSGTDTWLKPENREKAVSELYRLANYVVMRYAKKPGKELVMYMDYINWPKKIYQEQWFSVVDYVPFETFGVPIPAYYDEILKRIYGDYHVRVRLKSMHGYPMYEKQLQQLRDMLSKLEDGKGTFQAKSDDDAVINGRNRRVLVIEPDETCYGVLRNFSCQLVDELRKRDICAVSSKELQNNVDILQDEWKAIVGFQAPVLQNRQLAAHAEHTVQFIFDHPVFLNLFRQNDSGIYLCQDEYYAEYLKRIYGISRAYAFPPGGVDAGFSDNVDRPYDIVFIGSYEPPCFSNEWNSESCQFYEYMKEHPWMTFEEGFASLRGISIEQMKEKPFLDALKQLSEACRNIIRWNRDRIMRTIIDAEIPVHVFGESWKQFKNDGLGELIIHNALSVEESLEVLGRAKISLNIMSWHKAGMTERIANTLLSGAVSVSDETTYLREHFKDGEELVLFNLMDIEALPDKIRYLLEHEDVRRKIAQNGYQTAKQNHTWGKRAEELLQILEREV